MRKKLGLWAVGTATVVLLGLGVAVLVKSDGRSSDAAESSAFTYVSDPNYYTEKFRPQYHLSPESGNMSDPNGMVYFEGEYHQFYQNSGQWGHAVSKDLTHWEHLPVALARDSIGEIWSGSAVVDSKDTSGFFGGKAGLVAIFTHFKGGVQSQSIAYSADKGRTWTKYEGNPVIPNPGLKDFRDPKVIWHEPTRSWVMVVSVDNRVRFYTSPDLKSWKMTSEFGSDQGSHAAVWECPDLFELPVEGSKAKKWVLAVSIGSNNTTKGSTAQYFVGTFDGQTFKNDNKPSDVLWTDYGKDFYAAVSYSDIPANDGRRIWLGWMSNWRYPFAMPTGSWKGNMSIPRELRLRNIPDLGLRLIQEPLKELQTLRGKEVTLSKQELTAGHNPFDAIKGTSYEMATELSVQPNAKLAFKLRKGSDQETSVSYDAKTEQLTVDRTHSGITSFEKGFAEKVSAPMKLKDGKLKLRFFVDESSLEVFGNDGEVVVSILIFPDPPSSKMFVDRVNAGRTDFTANFASRNDVVVSPVSNHVKMHIYVDESSVEVFGNDGKVVFSDIILPDSARDGLNFYATGGNVTVVSMSVYPLGNTWRDEPTSGTIPQKVVMDKPKLEIGVGSTQQLYTTVLPRTATNKNLTWSTSNPTIATVSAVDTRSANISGISPGRAVITATTQSGSIVGTTVIQVGPAFSTNLTGWTSTNKAQWIPTADGIAGYFDLDSNYMSTVTGGNFTYEADMKLDALGGAGSIIFRGDATGSKGYYFNVDPSLKTLRLLYKLNGSFTSSQIIGSVPMLLQSSKTYHVKIVTSGTNIKVYFDGGSIPLIDVNDSHFSSGNFGLNLFGGRAYYQNVIWSAN